MGRFPAATQQVFLLCFQAELQTPIIQKPESLTGDSRPEKSAPFCQLHLRAEDVPESRPLPGARGTRLGGGRVGAESRDFVAAVCHSAGGSPGLRDVGWGSPTPSSGLTCTGFCDLPRAESRAARSERRQGMGVAPSSRERGADGVRTHSCHNTSRKTRAAEMDQRIGSLQVVQSRVPGAEDRRRPRSSHAWARRRDSGEPPRPAAAPPPAARGRHNARRCPL